MAQLTVRFIGLAALVPPRDQGDEWLSVLPNLRDGKWADNRESPFDIPPHQALVVVRARDLDAAKTDKSPKLRATLAEPSLNGMLPAGDELVFFEPRTETIRLASGSPGLQVENETPTGFGKDAAKAGEENNLWWVPPLAEISQDCSRFNRGLLANDLAGRRVRPATDQLAGTFVLDRGRLEATGVFRAVDAAALYEFRAPDEDANADNWRQSLATGYQLRATLDAETATLVFEDDGGNRRRVVLRGPDIQIWVINRELDEVLGFTNLYAVTAPDPTGDKDFGYFYAVAEGWDATKLAGVRIPYVTNAGPGGLTKPCGAPRFAS